MTWSVGKNSWEKKEEAGLLFGGEPHRLDEGQKLASVPSGARFQFLPLHPSLLTRRISLRRIIAWRDCACSGHVISVRNPDGMDALTRQLDFLIPARASTLIPEVELENSTRNFMVNLPLKLTITNDPPSEYANIPCRGREIE